MVGLGSIGSLAALTGLPMLLVALWTEVAPGFDHAAVASRAQAEPGSARYAGGRLDVVGGGNRTGAAPGTDAWQAPLPSSQAYGSAAAAPSAATRFHQPAGVIAAAAPVKSWSDRSGGRLSPTPQAVAHNGCGPIGVELTAMTESGGRASRPARSAATTAAAQVIEFEVVAAEIARREIGRLEINWHSKGADRAFAFGIADDMARRTDRGTASAVVLPAARELRRPQSKIERRLQLLERQGNLRVLARRQLQTLNGRLVRFDASGNLLIPRAKADGTMAVGFEALGVAVELTPRRFESKVLGLELRTQVSSAARDGGIAMEGFRIPVVTTTRGKVEVQMAGGQTLAVTNLFMPNAANDADLFPMLGELPIVGQLFQSRRFQEGETELVLLITPRLIDAAERRDIIAACESSSVGK